MQNTWNSRGERFSCRSLLELSWRSSISLSVREGLMNLAPAAKVRMARHNRSGALDFVKYPEAPALINRKP